MKNLSISPHPIQSNKRNQNMHLLMFNVKLSTHGYFDVKISHIWQFHWNVIWMSWLELCCRFNYASMCKTKQKQQFINVWSVNFMYFNGCGRYFTVKKWSRSKLNEQGIYSVFSSLQNLIENVFLFVGWVWMVCWCIFRTNTSILSNMNTCWSSSERLTQR